MELAIIFFIITYGIGMIGAYFSFNLSCDEIQCKIITFLVVLFFPIVFPVLILKGIYIFVKECIFNKK